MKTSDCFTAAFLCHVHNLLQKGQRIYLLPFGTICGILDISIQYIALYKALGVVIMADSGILIERFTDNVNERLINAVIGLLGGILIFAGILFAEKLGEKWEAVIISVGASLVASSVVSYLSSIYTYKRKRAKEITETWGLKHISADRAQMHNYVGEKLDKATDHLDIIAYGLKSFRESKKSVINEKVRHGMSIRIITVDPKCSYLTQRDIDEDKVAGSTSDSIIQLCKWVSELKQVSDNKIGIRFCNTLPTEVYFRVDGYIYTGPYQFGKESQRTITME